MISIDKAVVAKIDKGKKQFEILVDPASAANAKEQLKKGKQIDMMNVLAIQDVFEDSKKGFRASKKDLQAAFETSDIMEVAEIILKEGVLHTTEDQRDKEKQEKYDRIASLIAMNAVDAQTKKVIPKSIIESAMKQAKFHVDERKVEDQIQDAIKQIKKIIPLSFQERTIQVSNISANLAGKCHELCKKIANVERETWNADKSWTATIKVPAGLREELMDKLNEITKGKIDMKLID